MPDIFPSLFSLAISDHSIIIIAIIAIYTNFVTNEYWVHNKTWKCRVYERVFCYNENVCYTLYWVLQHIIVFSDMVIALSKCFMQDL